MSLLKYDKKNYDPPQTKDHWQYGEHQWSPCKNQATSVNIQWNSKKSMKQQRNSKTIVFSIVSCVFIDFIDFHFIFNGFAWFLGRNTWFFFYFQWFCLVGIIDPTHVLSFWLVSQWESLILFVSKTQFLSVWESLIFNFNCFCWFLNRIIIVNH